MELQENQETSQYSQSENKEGHKEQEAFLHEVDNSDNKFGVSLPLIIAIAAVAIIVIEVIISWIMVGSNKAKIINAESRINDATRQLSDEKTKLPETEKYAAALNNAFTVYNQEITKDKDLTPLWDELKIIMVPNSRLKSVAVDDKGTIKLEGEAKSYIDVANLIASFNKKSQRMTKINLVNLTAGENIKSFSISATYNPPKDSNNNSSATKKESTTNQINGGTQ